MRSTDVAQRLDFRRRRDRRRALAEGFNARHAPDGREGDEVVLFVQSGALVVEAPGTLMTDTLFGEEVRVVNEATRTVSTGVLVEPGRVQIQ